MKKARNIIVFLYVGLFLSGCGSSPRPGGSEREGHFYFILNEDRQSVTITGYARTEQEINVPSQIHGLPVTVIGDFAFEKKELTSVIIPDSVTVIGDYAFYSNKLTSVTIPDSVTSIRVAAFGANKLTSVVIPNSVTSIEVFAFGSNQLTSVTISDSVTFIGSAAFINNPISSITIGENVYIANGVLTGEIKADSFDNNFPVFYNRNSKRAGMYTFNDGIWSFNLQ